MNDKSNPKPCPARESGGYSCELEEGHEGGHACPKAVARFDELRRGVLPIADDKLKRNDE